MSVDTVKYNFLGVGLAFQTTKQLDPSQSPYIRLLSSLGYYDRLIDRYCHFIALGIADSLSFTQVIR